jgi:hypothetical protein
MIAVTLRRRPPTENAAEAAAPSAPPTVSVDRSALTRAIFDREPVDAVDQVASDSGRVFYVTEIRDLVGATLRHRWEYAGDVMAEVPSEIGGAHWRIYSS